ncbi:MAG: phosphatidylinositol-3-phosphatase [Pseudonocardiales bacterium]|jgi:acid phosphatase|nr:phosphatidylinositol-3-phosphatase [Pseudonocardiales bacterium]
MGRAAYRRIRLASIATLGCLLVLGVVLVLTKDRHDIGPVATADGAVATLMQDAYVNAGTPGANYGAAPTLQQQASRTTQISYLSFDVQGITESPARAVLRLFSRSTGSTRTSVSGTSSGWTETGITWANRPAPGSPISTTGVLRSGQWTEADVTAAVTATGVVSFALTTSATATRLADSREGPNPPQLVLTPGAAGSSANPSDPMPGGHVTKLLTVVVENHSLSQMTAGMPYLDSLAQRFAYASNYTAIRHPSLPNYLAIVGGSAFGVTDNNPPSSHPIAGDSIFDQALARDLTAATYAESMPSNCALTPSGAYAVKHNPWAYFSDPTPRRNCQNADVPAGTPASGNLASDAAAGRLPNAGLWIPNLCNDAHDCSLRIADNYLESWLPQLMAAPDFQTGRLAIVVTADEDNNTSVNRVLTVVLHRSLDGSRTVVNTALTHYSLTRLYDQVLGADLLRNAVTAPDMQAAFKLP